MSCGTLQERIAANSAKPCAKAFRPVFPEAIAGYVAPSVLFLGMTIIGYGLSTGRKWAVSGLVSPDTQMSIMLLLMVADHASSFWDHSRLSEEKYCLTAMLTPSRALDGTKGRLVFGGLGALLTAASVYGLSTGSITLAATSVPFAAMMMYLCWSPKTFQSCKANAMVTGGLAFGLDIMTFVGIMETLQAGSGSKDISWHRPTVLYAVVISCLFVALFGWHSDYGKMVKPGSCAIDDEADKAAESLRDRKPEPYTGVLMSVTSFAYFIYLKSRFSRQVSCCSVYPALIFLVFDVLTKLQVYKRGESLVGDAAHRSFVYVTVQVLDILLSSSFLISVMAEKSLLQASRSAAQPRALLAHAVHLAGSSITYVWSVVRLVRAIIVSRGGGNKAVATSTGSGSIKRLAEVVKLVSLNVAANLVPLLVDQKNATYMANASPQNDLNVPCHVK